MYLPVGLAMPVPSFALKLVMGEMTKMLTNSTRVLPRRAIESEFKFQFVDLAEAVKDLKARKI